MENGLFCCFEDKMLSLCFLLVFLFFDHSKVGRDYEEEHRVHILILHSYLFILITEALPGQRSYSFSNGISYWFLRACICMCALSCLPSGHVPFFPPVCAPWSCHRVSRQVFLISLKPASRLIRAGIQPPWLHLTISHQATYSIISCLNWRALLSGTQADRKFPFISYIKPASRTQTKQAQHQYTRAMMITS